jgi:hypothetical protein
LFIHLLICAYTVCTIFSPYSSHILLPPTWLPLRQTLFCPLFQFGWRENISNNKTDRTFLLAWDKDSSTERLLILLPCTYVLQPKLVHLYQTSSLLLGHFPIVASVNLRLLYLLLYSWHLKHFQVLGFLPFPYSSCTHSPLSMWPMSNNMIAFVSGLKSAYEGEHMIFGLLNLANFA